MRSSAQNYKGSKIEVGFIKLKRSFFFGQVINNNNRDHEIRKPDEYVARYIKPAVKI